jgi:hypothetical protein
MRWAFACLGLVACGFSPKPPPAAGDDDAPTIDAAEDSDAATAVVDASVIDAPPALHLRVEAKIDGRSNLIIRGKDVTWNHFQFAAPGRENFTNLPTKLDAFEWQPVWPDIPDAENRDCNCLSQTFTDLPVGLPAAPSTITVTHLLGRRTTTPSVLQQPTAENDFTLVLEFTDVGLTGSDIYAAQLDVVPN